MSSPQPAEATQPEQTLFDLPAAEPGPAPAETTGGSGDTEAAAPADPAAGRLASRVIGSRTFKRQREIGGRIPVTDERIATLLTSLLSAPDRRIPTRQAATDLDVSTGRLRRALSAVKRLLDIEGYVVLNYETESGDVVLDEPTLREQFGITK